VNDSVLQRATSAVRAAQVVQQVGKVSQVLGTVVEVRGLRCSVGDICWIFGDSGRPEIPCEVVGFRDESLLVMPFKDLVGVSPGQRVATRQESMRVPVGPVVLGRVLDGLGRPRDGKPAIESSDRISIQSRIPEAMTRQRVELPQRTGVKAIDAFVPCAKGQRVGIMAGSGVGKSVLLGMISRHSDADVNVVALIGERGREVREFVEEDLGDEGLKRTVVVVATSDESPVLRIRAAQTAMAYAEWFRDKNKNVMLVMDSVTRFAMAQREVGLAVGEPPATRGYPPSVFAALAKLLERAGTSEVNAITAFFTVLVEGDDLQDPVGDAVRSIVDGHIVLSRDLARRGHYPAIDVMGSVSRLASKVSTPGQMDQVRRILHLLKVLEDNEDLVTIGAYASGSNPDLDRALVLRERIDAFLRQGLADHFAPDQTLAELAALAAAAG